MTVKMTANVWATTASPPTAKLNEIASPIHIAARNGRTSRKPFVRTRATRVRYSAPASLRRRHPSSASIAVEVHRVVADRAGFRGVLPLVRGLCGDRDHVALSQMMTHPALDTGPARLAGGGYLRVDHLAAGDELRFAIHDDEHVVGVVVHLGAALHAAVGDDDQTFILDDAPALDEGGRNLVVVHVVDARRKTGGSSQGYQGGRRENRGECEQVFHERSPLLARSV